MKVKHLSLFLGSGSPRPVAVLSACASGFQYALCFGFWRANRGVEISVGVHWRLSRYLPYSRVVTCCIENCFTSVRALAGSPLPAADHAESQTGKFHEASRRPLPPERAVPFSDLVCGRKGPQSTNSRVVKVSWFYRSKQAC